MRPGSSWSSSPTASPRRLVPRGRFGEERLRSELAGVGNPALATQKLEAALTTFTAGRLDDDAAILAVGPVSTEVGSASGEDRELVERLFEAFNRRDEDAIHALCEDHLEFFPVGTAEAIGRTAPYIGPAGLHEYLGDVEKAWEELLVTPTLIERRGGSVLVHGRAYVRSRELGIRDLPMSWIWDLEGDRFVRGEVFPDPAQAVARLAASA